MDRNKMSKIENENSLKGIYKDFLEGELKRPEVRQARKDFLDAHFPEEPLFVLRPLVLASALASLALLAVFVYLRGPMMQESRSSSQVTSILASNIFDKVETATVNTPELPAISPRVTVDRISSRMGSTMVYQRPYNGDPITIVWVFVGGSAA